MLHDGKENVNIGLLGHVDCGKTSLAKVLSSQTGTACFDKSPQSQERGITLDLGFSAFEHGNFNFTVVDCPGHASLFKTVLCGAQIIDVFLLVIDAGKGMQAQTAECWILAEVLAERLVVVLNKADSVESSALSKLEMKIRSFLANSRFKNAPIVATSSAQGSGVVELKDAIIGLISNSPIVRPINAPFLFVVDHCFNLRGQGTVLTGTVLSGALSNKQSILIPSLNQTRKVKSIQSFRRALDSISAGDRAGICVPSLEAQLIERTLVCTPEAPLQSSRFFMLKIHQIKHFKQQLQSKTKLHITILNETVLARQVIFVRETGSGFEYCEELAVEDDALAIIELDRPVYFVESATVIGARLDFEPSLKQCRIAFHGRILKHCFTFNDICIYRLKQKKLLVDRIIDERRIIAYFEGDKKSVESAAKFVGKRVEVMRGDEVIDVGLIESTFGSSGRLNVSLNVPIYQKNETKLCLNFAKTVFQDQKVTFQLQNK